MGKEVLYQHNDVLQLRHLVMQQRAAELGRLIDGIQQGRKTNTDQLFELMYPELRRLAVAKMRRERSDHSWHPTVLVNELYLELLKNRAFDTAEADDERRKAFLGLAGFLMKRLLILHSRPLRQRTPHDGDEVLVNLATQPIDPESTVYVESLLDRMEAVDPRLRTVVEMRVFHGNSQDDIASRLGCSARSVGTLWSFARQWLAKELAREA